MSWTHRAIALCTLSLLALGAAGAQSSAPSATTSRLTRAEPGPEAARLANDLRSIVGEPGWRDARHAVLVVSLDRGDTLFSLNPDLPLAPASNMKLFTTAAALYYLSPDFRYTTYLLADGPVERGILHGDLVLYGTGDPSISGRLLGSARDVLLSLADTLAALGVREVRGDVVGDGSYFDDAWLGTGWNENDLLDWYAAPVAALSFAENMVSLRVQPGPAAGAPADLRTRPETDGLAVQNLVQTVSSGATRIRFRRDGGALVVEGRIRRGHPGVTRSVPVTDPANYAAAALRRVLADKGIRVTGGVRSEASAAASAASFAAPEAGGDASAGVVAAHLSPPLTELLDVTNQISHNLYAEALLKTVGRVALGDGSFEGGARAIRYFLECETGVDSTDVAQIDGSGLSRFNRATARATVRLLDYMASSAMAAPFLASLPEAGNAQTRSLRNRMGRTAAEENLRAKTGTIKNVSALSGYVEAANGERLAFSIMSNAVPSTWRAKRLEDAIGSRLAEFDRPPASSTASTGPGAAEAPEDTAGAPDGAEPRARPAPEPAETADAVAGEPENTPAAEPRSHRVRSGETFDSIARRYGITVAALRAANPAVEPRRLQIGQTLNLPN